MHAQLHCYSHAARGSWRRGRAGTEGRLPDVPHADDHDVAGYLPATMIGGLWQDQWSPRHNCGV
eukprot:4053889-Prorocentrum_lima.AAC.1